MASSKNLSKLLILFAVSFIITVVYIHSMSAASQFGFVTHASASGGAGIAIFYTISNFFPDKKSKTLAYILVLLVIVAGTALMLPYATNLYPRV
ncbi:MAG: hypothetical protein FWG30_11725 [Eubacteriaceae bacterium]|nr:hypothetical protein [Eubacteriaceae bacterium]